LAELLIEADIVPVVLIKELLNEANELTAIMTSSRNTSIKNHTVK
jgi:hypothetical protein